MQDPDLLEGENRVTYLSETGQYVFDWIDKDKRTVSFNSVRSDFDHVEDKIANKLKQNNIYVEESETETDTVNMQASDDDDAPLADPDGVAVDSESDDVVISEPTREKKPFDNALGTEEQVTIDEDDTDNNTSNNTDDNIENNDFEDLLVENEHEPNDDNVNTDTDVNDDESTENQDYPKYITFTAEISDLESKNDAIEEMIKDKKVKAKLQSGGPYDITYKISKSGSITIVRIEDLVLDAELSE